MDNGQPEITERTPTESTILNEACRLFADNGFDGTSIRDIAQAAGTSNAALYHYFFDKNDIYAHVVIAVTQKLCLFVEEWVSRKSAAPDKLRAFMRAYAEFFEENTPACIASSQSFRALENSPQRDRAIYWRDRFEGILRDVIRAGVASGEFRGGNVALTGRAVLSCLNWLHRWYSAEGTMRPVEIVDAFADIMLHGITVPAEKPAPRRARR